MLSCHAVASAHYLVVALCYLDVSKELDNK